MNNETEQPNPPTSDPIQSTCLLCRKEFTTRPQLLDDIARVPSLCDTCADLRDERIPDWAKICPAEFRLVSEGGQTQLARMDKSCPQWRKVLNWKYGRQGLLIRGESGRCKTRAVWRLLREQFRHGRKIVWMTSARFDRECRDAGGMFSLTAWFNKLSHADLFFLDDLGKAKWTDATEAQFFDLIDERTRECRPVLITMNDSGESLAARLSDDRAEPLVRRLRDYCQVQVF